MYRYDPYTDTSHLLSDDEVQQAQDEAREHHLAKAQVRVAPRKPKRELIQLSVEEINAKHKNTPLARRMARLYEEKVGAPFPGGIENACIYRSYAGYWQRAEGAKLWWLDLMDLLDSRRNALISFGSIWPAKEAVLDPDKLEWGW